MVSASKQNQDLPDFLTHDLPWERLYYADSTLKIPFKLTLANDAVLICENIIRLLPGKRLIALARLGDEIVVAKLFFNRAAAKKTCQRDVRGIQALLAGNILTPKLLYHGGVKHQRCISVIILEKINDSQNAYSFWQTAEPLDAKLFYLKLLTEQLAKQHQLNILQRDLHLKNFLITEKGLIYSLDGSRIKQSPHAISKKICLHYLALFLVQFGMSEEKLHQALIEVYFSVRNWLCNPQDFKIIQLNMQAIHKKSSARFIKKIFRNCTQFKKISTKTLKGMYDKYYKSTEFLELLFNPESFFQKPTTHILQSGPPSTIAKVLIDGRPFIIKRYQERDQFHAFRRIFNKTRVAMLWSFGQQLLALGVPTAKPVAFIDHVTFSNARSYFISEFVEGTQVGEFFSSYSSFNSDPKYKRIAEILYMTINYLKKMHFIHGDLKMTNILIDQNERPVLIDLERTSKYRSHFMLNRAFKKDIKLFMRNWENRESVKALFER